MLEVDLGILEKVEDWRLESRLFPSKAGGKPAWLSFENLPTPEELQCLKCQKQMIFLCQIYAPIDDDSFHRTLFVFVCRNPRCCERNKCENIIILRSTLGRRNKFYSYEPPKEEPDSAFTLNNLITICDLCGCKADKHCSKCKLTAYCCKEHQILSWKETHKNQCGSSNNLKSISKQLFQEFKIAIEPEGIEENEPCMENEFAEFKKLEAEGNTGTLKDIPEVELNNHARSDYDKPFSKFRKRVDINPYQVIRYERGGKPLWIAMEPVPDVIPNCEYCGSNREFEFQIMPQMLSILKENELDWGVIVIYTCRQSCTADSFYKKEYVFKQDISNENI